MADGDGQSLSAQDRQDLTDIATKLPKGHPMQPKIATLLASTPTQFEKDRTPQEGGFGAIWNDVKDVGRGIANFTTDPGAAIKSGAKIAQDYTDRQQEGRSPLYNAAATGVTASGIMNTRPMEEAANRGDVAGVAGHMAVPIAQAASPLIGEGAVRSFEPNSWLAKVGRNAETGVPRGPSSVLGTDVRPIADALLPKRTISPPAQEIAAARDTMYNDLGTARMNRPEEEPFVPQGTGPTPLLGEAKAAVEQQKLGARMNRGYKNVGQEPFIPQGTGETPLLGEARTLEEQQKIGANMNRGYKNVGDSQTSVRGAKGSKSYSFSVDAPPERPGFVPKVGAGPAPEVRMVGKFEPPAKSTIVQPGTPEAQPPRVEGSYWSFKEPALRQTVLAGDRDAAIVYKQRFGTLPPGAKYITDVGDKPNRGLYETAK